MNSAGERIQLIEALRGLAKPNPPRTAMATLTRTRGSTFRRPGTRMLVHADGSVVCELSGGCPQRDIVVRAQDVIASGEPRLVAYNPDSGLDVLMEMGCGGELEVLLEPMDPAEAARFANALTEGMDLRRDAWLATVFAINDAVGMPRRLLWNGQGVTYDEIRDPALASLVMEAASINTASRKAATMRMPFQTRIVDVLIESIEPPHALVVIGASAVARAVLPLSQALGWVTTWVDSDPARLRAGSLPQGLRTVCTTPGALGDTVCLDAHTSAIVVTHNLEQDIAWLEALRGVPLAYLGTLGSRERVARMRASDRLDGLRLHAPAGLDIGSETPQEISLAVLAEVMAVINKRHGGSLGDNDGAIH